MTGQIALLYYAGDIFTEICPTSYYECILGLGIVKALPAYLMIFTADLIGRRTWLLAGGSVLVVAMIVLDWGLSVSRELPSLVGIYLAVASFEFSYGTMLWILLGEIFPQFVRSAAISISVATLFACFTILTFAFPYLYDSYGLLNIFIFFTCSSAAAVAIVYFFAPETVNTNIEYNYKRVSEKYSAAAVMCGCTSAEDDDDDSATMATTTGFAAPENDDNVKTIKKI